MQDMGGLIISEWHKQATLALKHPAGYVRQIDSNPQYPDADNPLHIRIECHHEAAFFLEVGTGAFDIKKMLGTSDKVKISKEGKRYIRIPFEHSKMSLVEYGIGTEAAGLMATRRQVPTVQNPRSTVWGKRLKAGEIGRRSKIFPVTGALARGAGERVIRYTWKASPFENLVRMEDKFGQTRGYSTFRTISEISDPDSWLHPGIQASHIAEKTTEIIRPVLIQSLGDALQRAFNAVGQK
jgi:hypothetical protein